ncbi:hypothetical protein AAFF_G00382740 [Aldrovandia affinis]|uniref:Coiled-coil domain-containing protein 73 n=1 Tax=Aldrovandia affinis TaxID=143900 RepID=A0AAD7T8I5_9TELE|nr:hypothetical protein AAFF_G00382740 [Aldrovandia affinis]
MCERPEESFPSFLLNSEMAVNTDSENHFPDSLNGKQDFEHELSLYTPQESDDGIHSVQVLEFKTSLLEAVEELHIHRDAEMRFKEQINKLVLEKQEIEWEKESLQHKIDTLVNQHNESLVAKKKQFQARITGIEGEKGRHQLSAELKEREISGLKEELKLLQLFKYSLEKKLTELEQKLQLQVQTKDSHLSQLSEVERHFGALSRQCVMVKQAHEKLVLNVEEAMRLNKKLTFLNKKQETTINSLKQDVEKVNSELIKSKVCSVCKCEEGISHHTAREQRMQQLQHRLHVETEINKRLMKENAVVMAEKQEVMSSLRQAQLLLQTQTVALSQAELELSAHREEHQALKTEHKLFREKIEEKDGHIVSLVEEHNRSKTEWKNEEKILQETLHTDQEELKYVREAYDHLHEKCKQLSSHTTPQAELTQREKGDLMEFKKDNRKLISRNSEISVNARCETVDRAGEYGSLQDDGEPVNLQVSTKQGPSDCDEIGVTRQAPDEGGDAGPTGGAVSDEHPQADYRMVIAEQASSVYTPGCADAKGTVEGRHVVDPARALLQPFESSCTLARLPAGGALTADAADALGVCGAVTDKPIRRDSPAITRSADMLNTSSVRPHHKRDPPQEWNAIAQTFCETSAKLESTPAVGVYIPYGSTLSARPVSPVGISTLPASTMPGLPSPSGYTGEEHVPGPGFEGCAPCSQKNEQSEFSPQISAIEKFLCSERLKLQRKRKVDAESTNEH